jgi:Ser/Thr protein kinase RdoA (MazF antagonist)
MGTEPEMISNAIAREAAGLVGRYGFSKATRVELLSESENKIFLVTDPERTEKFVIRVNSGRLSYHNPHSIASELTWLMALRKDTNIVVPEVMRAGDGSLVQTISASDMDKPRHAVIYSFLAGREPPEDQMIPGFERLGEISARMHLHAKNWVPPPEFQRPSWLPDEIFGNLLQWGAWQDGVGIEGETLQLLSRLEKVVRKRTAEYPRDREHFGLIHADLRLANLLVDENRTAIIDFDDCGFGWYLFDFASALSFLEERPDVPELVASWLKGYRKVSSIPSDFEGEIPTLIMLRRLQLIGWVGYQQHHLEFAREIGSDFTIDTCRLARDYLARFG